MTVLPLFSNDQCCGTISDSGATIVELLITEDQEAKVCVSPSKLLVPDIPLTADTQVRCLILSSNASLYCAFTKTKTRLAWNVCSGAVQNRFSDFFGVTLFEVW